MRCAILAMVGVLLVAGNSSAQRAGRDVAVEVTDKSTGESIARAEVGYGQEKTITDEYGQCVVRMPISWENFSIDVTHAGYASMGVHWGIIDAATKIPQQINLAMTPGTKIGGRVLDETGKAVANAAVELRTFDPGQPDGFVHNELFADLHTDASGTWFTDTAPADLAHATIRVSHPDFYDENFAHDVESPAKLRDRTAVATLRHAVNIPGIVVDPDGHPVAEATVTAGAPGWYDIHHRARTDERGRFELTHMPPGAATFCVRSWNFAPVMVTTTTPTTQPVEVRLALGTPLKLHVVDLHGKPLPGANIDVDEWERYQLLNLHLRTDASGNAVWPHAPGDELSLNISKPGLGKILDQRVVASTQPIVLALGPQTKISGTVVDAATGEPIKNFSVDYGTISEGANDPVWQSAFNLESSAVKRDSAGHFTFTLGEYFNAAEYMLRVKASRYMPADSPTFKPAAGEMAMRFALEKSAPITGRVFGLDHKPLANAVVYCDVDPGFGIRIEDHAKVNDWSRRMTPSTQTDADGRFSFLPQATAFNLICITDDGYAQLDVPAAKLSDHAIFVATLSGAKTPSTSRPASYDLTLEPWASINGRLMIGSHIGANSKVVLSGFPGEDKVTQPRVEFFYTGQTDGKGRFHFDRVPAGKASVGRVIQRSYGESFTNYTLVSTFAGRTSTVQVGGMGRAIVGRFKFPPGVRPDTLNPMNAMISTHFDVPREILPPEMPAEIKRQTREVQEKWWNQWTQTPAGRKYLAIGEKVSKLRKIYAVEIFPDGRFRIDDVAAGKYDMMVRFVAPGPMMAGQAEPRAVGAVDRQVVVPEMAGGRSDQVLDMGVVRVGAPGEKGTN